MTVKELRERLAAFPDDALALIDNDEFLCYEHCKPIPLVVAPDGRGGYVPVSDGQKGLAAVGITYAHYGDPDHPETPTQRARSAS